MENEVSLSQIARYNCIYSNETIALFSSLDILRTAFVKHSVEINPYPAAHNSHSHIFYELHSMLEGEATYLVGGREIVLHSGEYLIFPKKCTHHFRGFSEKATRFIIAFDATLGTGDIIITEPRVKRLTARCTAALEALVADESPADILDQYARVVAVALRLILDYTERDLSLQSDYISNEYVRAIAHYLRDNRHRVVTIPELLEHCHCNHRNINYILKREMNTNISSVVNRHKADLIADFLQNTDKSLAEIAEQTGFSTEYSLSRFFIREFKTTPGRFRKASVGYQRKDSEGTS